MNIFRNSKQEVDFVIHEHRVGSKIDYQLSIQDGDELRFLSFNRTGEMETISNVPNITKLFGESEEARDPAWLTYEGQTKNSEWEGEVDGRAVQFPGFYNILDSGKAIVGTQDDNFSEVFLSGEKLTDRWIIRKLPNLFPKVFDSSNIFLFWKPPVQKSFNSAIDYNVQYHTVSCECPVKNSSDRFAELSKQEGVVMNSEIVTDVKFDGQNQTFEGIAGAEGTWIDMFNTTYTYTKEFIIHHYKEQLARLQSGDTIELNTQHDLEHQFEGKITGVRLVREPIYHIVVNGIYTGPADLTDGEYGLSYEYRLRSSWNEEFQSWVPFSATTDKISVVRKPACKICWINKVKQ